MRTCIDNFAGVIEWNDHLGDDGQSSEQQIVEIVIYRLYTSQMPRTVIAFVGFKSSGKNTAALAFAPFGFTSISFADALKDMLAAIFCWNRDMLEGITPESRVWREQVDPWWADRLCIPEFSPRFAMMHIATEVMRKQFNEDVWVHNVERRLLQLPETDVVLPDMRFPNEIALARRFGARIIRIQRGDVPDWFSIATTANTHPEPMMRQYLEQKLRLLDVHRSEYAWIGTPVDTVISNDGTIAELHTKVLATVNAADPIQ